MKLLILSLVLLAFIQLIKSDECRSCTNCVKCLSKTVGSTPDTQAITISTQDCSDYPINWLCCRWSSESLVSNYPSQRTSCTLTSCNSQFEDDKLWDLDMCQDVSFLTYEVPSSANYITVQIHENCFNGNVNCKEDSDCCGESFSTCPYSTSGVCQNVVDLSTCNSDTPAPECESDSDCSHLDHDCSAGRCVQGSCTEAISGESIICRPASGDCDEEERCDGYNNFCPEDNKKGETEICREKASSCDFEETCDGWSNECPEDIWEAAGVECRPVADKCDVAEYCTGDSSHCPDDFGHDFGYTYKCALTQFLCGVQKTELSSNKGGSYFIGSGSNVCGIGTAGSFVDLDYPECLSECINANCPNNRGLSNWSESHCDPATGLWVCDKKFDVSPETKLPYCPVWQKK